MKSANLGLKSLDFRLQLCYYRGAEAVALFDAFATMVGDLFDRQEG
jgi:hypothetical protein